MPELKQKYQIGDEVEVTFIGRVTEVRIKTLPNICGTNGDIEKVIYRVENETARGIDIEEAHIVPLLVPEDVPIGCECGYAEQEKEQVAREQQLHYEGKII